jgi:hypothetical protein
MAAVEAAPSAARPQDTVALRQAFENGDYPYATKLSRRS